MKTLTPKLSTGWGCILPITEAIHVNPWNVYDGGLHWERHQGAQYRHAQTAPLPPALPRHVQAIPGSCCVHTAPATYQSCTSLCSYTTTDHPVTPEFVPRPPPVLAGLTNQGELPCKVHMVFLGGIILFYNHSVGNVSMFFPMWLFLFFPYTDVLEVCLKPKLWMLFANVRFSCNTIQFWCVCDTENVITAHPVGRSTRQNKSQRVLLQNRAELTVGQGCKWPMSTPENSCRNLLCLYYTDKAGFSKRSSQTKLLKKNKVVGCQLNETWWLQGDLCKQCLLPWAAWWLVNLPEL